MDSFLSSYYHPYQEVFMKRIDSFKNIVNLSQKLIMTPDVEIEEIWQRLHHTAVKHKRRRRADNINWMLISMVLLVLSYSGIYYTEVDSMANMFWRGMVFSTVMNVIITFIDYCIY
jgi:hypothetical protein